MTTDAWYRFLLDPQTAPLAWVAGSLAAYALVTHAAWAARWTEAGWPGRLTAVMQAGRLAVPVQAARLFYYLVIPYLALVWGIFTPRNLGLVWPDNPVTFRQSVAIAAGLTTLLAVAWAHYARRQPGSPPGGESWPSGAPALVLPLGWAVVLREAVFAQAHWALYRAGFTALLQNSDLGIWLGLAVILLEGYLNPWLRHDLRRAGRAEPILLTAQLAVVTTALFLIGGSTWLTLAWHAVAALAVPWWVHGLQRHDSAPDN
jgi:hypothetical protein